MTFHWFKWSVIGNFSRIMAHSCCWICDFEACAVQMKSGFQSHEHMAKRRWLSKDFLVATASCKVVCIASQKPQAERNVGGWRECICVDKLAVSWQRILQKTFAESLSQFWWGPRDPVSLYPKASAQLPVRAATDGGTGLPHFKKGNRTQSCILSMLLIFWEGQVSVFWRSCCSWFPYQMVTCESRWL